MKIPKIIACIAALSLFPVSSAFADHSSIVGDVNMDGTVNISDGVVLARYLHGNISFTRDQFDLADVNKDDSADSLDLAQLKYIITANSGRMPVGTWVIPGTAEDYFYFDGNGNVTVTHTYDTPLTNAPAGTVTENTITFEDGKLIMTDENQNTECTISWVNSSRFDITYKNGIRLPVIYYGSEPLVYDQLLNGMWISDSGRSYGITGVYGYYLEAGGDNGIKFNYKKDFNRLTFHFDNGDGDANAFITAVDSMHIDLTWDDGRVERLTKQNIETIDGVTYVNGILIANKTYGLPSTYAPNGILPDAQTAFNEMQAAARRDGLSLTICSGYRSYTYQRDLYNSYVNRDGKAKADTYSARPGHSEHQTGLAMDINMAGDAFNNTPEAKWLAAHCAEYGFIIRYPQGKQDITGYKYESWHVRYLGKELAREVTDSGLTLEEFLCIDSAYKY
ncbi:MAG: D-alanyl-D-alanine carboxypeptidase family protein [Ruminococcus sp.]|nr:D-alanyl-D-alanine carboxypeptidase family protein [Ruminococcus sp.]